MFLQLYSIMHHLICNPYDNQYIDRLGDVAVDDSISQTNPSPATIVCLRKLVSAHFFLSQNNFTTIKLADNKASVDETNSERYSFIKYRRFIVSS